MLPFPYLDRATLTAKLPMQAAIDALRAAFADDVENPPRALLGQSLFMPGRVRQFTGIKVVSTKPGNPVGLVTVYDKSGTPIGMVDGAALTPLRTGAATGLATDLLARPEATTLAMLGAGAISAHQVEGVCNVRRIQRIVVWSRQSTNAHKLETLLRAQHRGITVEVADSADRAVASADIICCATPARSPLFHAGSVRRGAHINAVGAFTPAMIEVPCDTVRGARVFVESYAAATAEAGDLLQAQRRADGEICDLLANRTMGRQNDTQVTLFKSVGIASMDVACAVAALLGSEALNFFSLKSL